MLQHLIFDLNLSFSVGTLFDFWRLDLWKKISATAQCMVLWFWHFLISIGNGGPNHLISLWSFGPNMFCFILGFHEISTKRQRGINQRSPWIFQVLFNCCFSKLLWVTVMKNPFCDLCQISIIYLRIYTIHRQS